jgi:hypothetical protein
MQYYLCIKNIQKEYGLDYLLFLPVFKFYKIKAKIAYDILEKVVLIKSSKLNFNM